MFIEYPRWLAFLPGNGLRYYSMLYIAAFWFRLRADPFLLWDARALGLESRCAVGLPFAMWLYTKARGQSFNG